MKIIDLIFAGGILVLLCYTGLIAWVAIYRDGAPAAAVCMLAVWAAASVFYFGQKGGP